MTEPSLAVFLSYASQDAEAAQRICTALRSAGVDVWFDQSELRGGDAWDQTIRKRLHDCRLFIPIISANTEARPEGYFRREWKLAVDRTHDMSQRLAFLVPVVIDRTPEARADVPDAFRSVQWTDLPAGETPQSFVQRVQALLRPHASSTSRLSENPVSGSAETIRAPGRVTLFSKGAAAAIVALVIVAIGYLALERFLPSKRQAQADQAVPPATPIPVLATAAFNPPPHSIAVLPFVNMSGDKTQEYFSDGLTEELLNSLVRINELQVAARTSSFSFKGKDADIASIARKLNVGVVLEGSIRTGGHRIRVTTELTNAITGFHLWSQTYDRQLSDVLELQTDIAKAVTSALRLTLLGNLAETIEMGGTHNPAAFDAYLRASKSYRGDLNENSMRDAVAGYTEAIRLDPGFATAYADRSLVLDGLFRNYPSGGKREYQERSQADARKAITLVPDLAVGHLALAEYLLNTLSFPSASAEYARARDLAPGDAKVLQRFGQFEVLMGHSEVGLDALRRSVALDPLNSGYHFRLGEGFVWARRTNDALASFNKARALEPDDLSVYGWLGYTYLTAHEYQKAKEACGRTIEDNRFQCLAMAYYALGQHADADAMIARLTSPKGGGQGVFMAMIYGLRGDKDRALDELEQAVRDRDPYLEYVKTNAFLDPLREEPRFQAIQRSLRFPD
jgi:TolB-like protein